MKLRMRYGMTWRKHYPSWRDPVVRQSILVSIVLILLGEVMILWQRNDRLEKGIDEILAWRDSYRDQVTACLNHGQFYYPDSKVAFECRATELGEL